MKFHKGLNKNSTINKKDYIEKQARQKEYCSGFLFKKKVR